MTDSDNPQAGPLTIDEYLDQKAPEEGQAEAEEVETTEPEGEVEPEAEEAEGEDAEKDEPEPEDDAPEAYSVDEYGEITVELADGTRTTLKDLAAGTLRQADYSRKTAELAQKRKELEQEAEKLAQRERQLNEQFASLEEPEPDWRKLAEEDPLGWQLTKLEWDSKQQQKAQRKRQAEEARKAEIEAFRRFTAEKAIEVFPEWRDVQKFNEGAPARKQACLEVGFSEAEYNQAIDLRMATLLEKAARYDAGQTKVQAAQKKLSKVPKVVKPGTQSTRSEREAAERVAKAKRINGPVGIQEYLSAKGL